MPARKEADAPFQPNLYVVARFLDVLAAPDRTWTRSQLQLAVGVNYDIFRRYLDFLGARGYLVVDDAGAVRLTADGRRVRGELLAWIGRFLGAGGAPEPGAAARPPPNGDPGATRPA
ncbi:MAG TPA: hypothetical protein VHH36_01000 [Candidatus Thermoplasmatota archaeon]|nr:hypothetical protein [Candidatus Thermoplasmatota archaeon]